MGQSNLWRAPEQLNALGKVGLKSLGDVSWDGWMDINMENLRLRVWVQFQKISIQRYYDFSRV